MVAPSAPLAALSNVYLATTTGAAASASVAAAAAVAVAAVAPFAGAAPAGPAPPSVLKAMPSAAAATTARFVFPHVFMPEMCHIEPVTSEHFPQRVGRIP